MKINIKGIVRDKDTNVIRESVDYYDKIVNLLEVPYFKNLETIGIPEDQWNTIFSKLFDQPVIKDDEYLYDSNGNVIHYENSNGFWIKQEYDEKGELIYYENSEGFWYKYEYDSNGNELYYENSDGEWIKKEYDDNGDIIYDEDSEDGVVFDQRNNNLNESVDYYDKLLNILEPPYYQNLRTMGISEDLWETIFPKVFNQPVKIERFGDIRNDNGNLIYHEDYNGFWSKTEYDDNGNLIYQENSNGYWGKFEYDENGNQIYFENSNGNWEKYEYDENGNEIYSETSDGVVFDQRNNNLNESVDYYNKLLNVLQPPYYQNLETIGIPEEQWNTVFYRLYNQPIRKDDEYLYDENGNVIYRETSDGNWYKKEYDNNGSVIHYENSDGGWYKKEYNENNDIVYHEDSNGKWTKWIYDEKGNVIHYENSNGYWIKQEYDEKGNEIYYENSDGLVFDRRNNNLNESVEHYNKLLSILQPPYFKNLETMGIPEEQWETIFSRLYNQPIRKEDENLYDTNDNQIYYEYSDGNWLRRKYDNNGNILNYEDSTGYWRKHEYDSNGYPIYYENSDGEIVDNRNNNLNESVEHYNKLLSILQPPYYQNLEIMGISEDLWNTIFSKLFDQPVYIDDEYLYDKNGNLIYREYSDGYWEKSEYDDNGKRIYTENSNGYWIKQEYDSNGSEIYYETSDGYWEKREYDDNGNQIYSENSDGFWEKYEYDEKTQITYYENSEDYSSIYEYDDNGNQIYHEDSEHGVVFDLRNNNLNESVDYYNKLLNVLQPPYYQNLRTMGISEDLWESIFSKLFNQPVKIERYGNIRNDNGNLIYHEDSTGYWRKQEYDNNGNVIHYENSNGYWIKQEYDEKGELIYIENPDGVVLDHRNNNLNESTEDIYYDKYYDKIVNILDKPYYQNLETMGISEDHWKTIFSKLFDQPVYIDLSGTIRNNNQDELYQEDPDGFWFKSEYDNNGNVIHYENSDGYWYKSEYDSNGNEIYYENSNGYWDKWEYNDNGNITYSENSDGEWEKSEYNDNGNIIYFENSDGEIVDNRNNNLNESIDERYYDKLLNILQPPYFQNLRTIGISEDKYESIFSKLFDHPVKIVMGDVYNSVEYLENRNEIYYENSDGFWTKYEYDSNGNEIYSEDSNGNWEKYEYDENENEIYYEKSDGYWFKKEYNENGQITYIENSNGVVFDHRNNNNLNESVDDRYYDKIVNLLEVPYFKNLETIGISEEQYESIFSKLFNQPVYIDLSGYIRNGNDNEIYYENSYGDWYKKEYDENENQIYREDSEGYWYKKEYDENGNQIYIEDSTGMWSKYEYDEYGNRIYHENTNGVVFDHRNINLNESIDERYYDKIVNLLEVPYYQNLETMGIDEDKWEIILSKVFNQPVYMGGNEIYDGDEDEDYDGYWFKYVYDENDKRIYFENSEGDWKKFEYDDNGNQIYLETSEGYWSKNEYDSNGNRIYHETYDGYWYKKEYDRKGNQIYIEDSNGYWEKSEYDDKGYVIYRENTNGVVFDQRNNNLNESIDERLVNMIDIPYFQNLISWGIPEKQWETILSNVFNKEVTIQKNPYGEYYEIIYQDYELYYENSRGHWVRYEYNKNGNEIYREDSGGEWYKSEYDDNGNQIYHEDSYGYWMRYEYDNNGVLKVMEDSDGALIVY